MSTAAKELPAEVPVPFEFLSTGIPEVVVVHSRRFPDERGYFLETYKASAFSHAGIDVTFLQDNHSLSSRGTVRGLHYQLPPHEQGKLVRVVTGAVWDVVVDIRRSSPTFGRWVAERLDGETGRMLWVPPGFAHGFIALEDGTHLAYKCTSEYHQDAEAGIRFNDPELAIEWPDLEPLLSERDAALPVFADAEVFP